MHLFERLLDGGLLAVALERFGKDEHHAACWAAMETLFGQLAVEHEVRVADQGATSRKRQRQIRRGPIEDRIAPGGGALQLIIKQRCVRGFAEQLQAHPRGTDQVCLLWTAAKCLVHEGGRPVQRRKHEEASEPERSRQPRSALRPPQLDQE